MKRLTFLMIALLFGIGVSAQLPVQVNDEESSDTQVFKKKVDYSLSTGTSFLSSGLGKGSSYYIAPEFKLKLSPKFQMNAGIILSQSRFTYSAPVSLSGQSVVVNPGASRDATIYASGVYTLNSRLSFSGSLIKNFPGDKYMSTPLNNSFQMMTMGMKYKLTDNITIGAGMRMVQSNGGYYPYSGYYTPGSLYNTFDQFSPLNDL